MEWTQTTVPAEHQAGNTVTSRIEHVDQTTMCGHAHGSDASAWLNLDEPKSSAVHLEHRDRVTPRVHGKQPFLVVAQYQSTLIS